MLPSIPSIEELTEVTPFRRVQITSSVISSSMYRTKIHFTSGNNFIGLDRFSGSISQMSAKVVCLTLQVWNHLVTRDDHFRTHVHLLQYHSQRVIVQIVDTEDQFTDDNFPAIIVRFGTT